MERGCEDLGRIRIGRVQSAVGELVIGSFKGRLCMCDWAGGRRHDANLRRMVERLGVPVEAGTSEIVERAGAELAEYFAGSRRDFDIPLLMTGTPFQRAVRSELCRLAYGTTATYADIARRLGKPAAVRAVAAAIASNPISILVPCHRVTGSGGSLTGYAGGLAAKAALLDLERRVVKSGQRSMPEETDVEVEGSPLSLTFLPKPKV